MPRVLLCVVLSILLHLVLVGLFLLVPPQQVVQKTKKAHQKQRVLKVLRATTRKKTPTVQKKTEADARKQEQHPSELKPFAKTSADTPQARPEQPEYEGKRDTRAASEPDARQRASAEHAPAMNGEEKKEIATFDQERQEGDLTHEGRAARPTPPSQPDQPQPPAPPSPAPAEGTPEGATQPEAAGQARQDSQIDATKALTLTDDLRGLLKLKQDDSPADKHENEQQAARQGSPGGTGHATAPARPARSPRIFYDPSLADWAQKPGFRTYERRSRSSGRFILGKGAALNVASTPRGMYEALVYRRVAHFWYIACDEHRGDIIPGKIVISLRITKRGQIDSMALIRRSGASISQQSLTFKAIRQADLPPMPPEVQADIIGELMELIFEFNFD